MVGVFVKYSCMINYQFMLRISSKSVFLAVVF